MAYAVDDPGRLNGLTKRFTCPEGHPGSVVILNARLIEYTFLVQSVISRYISAIPKRGTPDAYAEDIYGLSSAFEVFEGSSSPISDEADGLLVNEYPKVWDLVSWVHVDLSGDPADWRLCASVPLSPRNFSCDDGAREDRVWR